MINSFITHNIATTSFRPPFFLPARCNVSLLHTTMHPSLGCIIPNTLRQPAPCRGQACFTIQRRRRLLDFRLTCLIFCYGDTTRNGGTSAYTRIPKLDSKIGPDRPGSAQSFVDHDHTIFVDVTGAGRPLTSPLTTPCSSRSWRFRCLRL